MTLIRVLIASINAVTPTKGTNAGRQMYVINGNLWSRVEPKPTDTHVVTEVVKAKDKDNVEHEYTNVVGFACDTRMPVREKIDIVVEHPAEYSIAVATLLK
jgi:hypothetical protein